MNTLEKYNQGLIGQGSILCSSGIDSMESAINDITIQYQLKPMIEKKFIHSFANFSRKFTYKELWKIALKCSAYYSPMRDSVFLMIIRFFPDEGACATIIDIDDFRTFRQLRIDPSIQIL